MLKPVGPQAGGTFPPRSVEAAPAARLESSRIVDSVGSDFELVEGGQQNYFLTQQAEAHVVVRPDSRVVASFPAENSGASLWFRQGRVQALELPRGESHPGGQALEVQMRSLEPKLVIDEAVLGSIRTVRERLRGTEGPEAVRRDRDALAGDLDLPESWARERASLNGRQLVFSRTTLDGRAYEAAVNLPAGVEVRGLERGWELKGEAGFDFSVRFSVPHEPLAGYRPEELFSKPAADLVERLDAAGDPRLDRALQSMKGLSFLARGGKFMAGSWRFLTYFGRDTLLSLAMLKPAITAGAFADGLQSVVDRLSEAGEVAHEEDLGPWAERRRVAELLKAARTEALAAAQPAAARPLAAGLAEELSRPLYDYKMVDDDFLFPVVLERADGLEEFLGRGSNLDRVVRNWSHVIARAEPFATASAAGEPREEVFRHLVRIREDENVGDWRDSNEGLGWGKYPGSVNVDLVPAALRAVGRMAGKLDPEELKAACERMGSPELAERLQSLGGMAEEWDGARDAYRVRLGPEQVRDRLKDYLEKAPMTEGERAFYLRRPVGEGPGTLGDFVEGGAVPPALRDGLSFMALSLDSDGNPMEVVNTDAAFRVFLGDPPRQDVEDILKLLELEYPVGLMTGVGPVVANPAYSLDPVHHRQLGRGAYHGSVVWSWQSAMLGVGLARQAERFSDDPALGGRIRKVIDRIAGSEERAGALATSELWTHRVEGGDWEAVAYGASAGDQTESNAAQLWSTVYPAVLLATG